MPQYTTALLYLLHTLIPTTNPVNIVVTQVGGSDGGATSVKQTISVGCKVKPVIVVGTFFNL